MRKIAREEWHKAAELGAPVVPCALVDLLRRSDPDLSTIPDDDGDILQVSLLSCTISDNHNDIAIDRWLFCKLAIALISNTKTAAPAVYVYMYIL